MASPDRSQVLLLLNTTGRQSVSIARTAAAVGFSVRAHISEAHKSALVAGELEELAHTTIFEGNLENATFRTQLFHGVKLAFINTTSFDDEEKIGKAFVDLAMGDGVAHVIYSSMPDHKSGDKDEKGWPTLPQWSDKAKVEPYALEKLGQKVTIVHTGIYHNNFTSLPYPLFQMREVELGSHGEWRNGEASTETPPSSGNTGSSNAVSRRHGNLGFEWCAPFPADVHLPWLDCEHDFGATILQIFKQGPSVWGGKRVPVAFSYLTPRQVCAEFARGVDVPVRYVEGPITITVPIPEGYDVELQALEKTLGCDKVNGLNAPYWWSGFFEPLVTGKTSDQNRHPGKEERDATVKIARELWPGWRSMEAYASDAFVEEERFNGRQWMFEEGEEGSGVSASGVSASDDGDEHDDDDNDSVGLEIGTVMPL